MRSEIYRGVKSVIKTSSLFIVLLMMWQTSSAVTITFDDIIRLPPEEGQNCFCPQEIGDAYLSLGLRSDGVLGGSTLPSPDGVSPSQALTGIGGGLWLEFVGELPTYVEFYVSAPWGNSTHAYTYGLTGLLSDIHTPGWNGPDDDTPYVENYFVSFSAAEGISRMFIADFSAGRVSSTIDNLTFTYSVPEPSAFLLFGIGLFGFVLARRKTILNKF